MNTLKGKKLKKNISFQPLSCCKVAFFVFILNFLTKQPQPPLWTMLLFNFSDFLNVFTKNFNIDGCSSASGSFKIEEGIFSLNTNLESIEIKCSLLTSIPETISLKHLPDLKHLSFHGSGLETIPHDLAHYHDLITLDLESNPLNCNCSMLLLYRLLTLPNPVQVNWSVKVGVRFLSMPMPRFHTWHFNLFLNLVMTS